MADHDVIKVRALLDHASVRPGSGKTELHLMVETTAVGKPVDAARPSLSVVFALDVSVSMEGEPLEQVKRSVRALVDLLAPEDKVGVVAFAGMATEVCALAPLTPEHKKQIQRRVDALAVAGGTNIAAGLTVGRKVLGARVADERLVLVLLTDGEPNAGECSPSGLAALSRSFRPDVSVTTLGYRVGHDSALLDEVARGGGGQYWFIREPSEAGVEFARALGAQADIVADAVELVLQPDAGVEIAEVLGHNMRFTKDGPVVSLPDLREQQKRVSVARVVVVPELRGELRGDTPLPERGAGPWTPLVVSVRFRAAGSSAARRVDVPVSLDVAPKEPERNAEAMLAVRLALAERARTAARVAADRGNFDVAAGILKQAIADLEAVPGYKQMDGSPLSEAVEQLVDERVTYEQKPSREHYEAFKATQIVIEVDQGARHSASTKMSSTKSQALLAAVSGPPIDGVFVVKDIHGHLLHRVPIKSEMTVGRSPDAEIMIPSNQLSRRHTRLRCVGDDVVVTDLASTNGTFVNGARILKPTYLKPGDKLTIGDVQIELERASAANEGKKT